MKKLCEGRGNLLRQVEMLKQLGIRTSKSLPQNLLDAAATTKSLSSRLTGESDEPGPPGRNLSRLSSLPRLND